MVKRKRKSISIRLTKDGFFIDDFSKEFSKCCDEIKVASNQARPTRGDDFDGIVDRELNNFLPPKRRRRK